MLTFLNVALGTITTRIGSILGIRASLYES